MNPHTSLISLIQLCLLSSHLATITIEPGHNVTREEKQLNLGLISIFNFPNDECTNVEGVEGECYTATECSSRGGVSVSTCGNGIGVCCYVIMVRNSGEGALSDYVYIFRSLVIAIRL